MEKLNELINKYRVLELESRITAGRYDILLIREIHVGVAQIYSDFQGELKSLTSSHREEIEKAYSSGYHDGYALEDDREEEFKDASDYYEKTYKK
jgi:hypothetical protein